jgi:MoaE-MoaD fusion protein
VSGPRVRVLLFAQLAELAGARERTVALQEGARARDVSVALGALTPQCAELLPVCRVARNGKLISPDQALFDGDELALLPPVGGG